MAFKQQVLEWLSSCTGSMRTAVAALAVSTGCASVLAQAPPQPTVQPPSPTTEVAPAVDAAVNAAAAPATAPAAQAVTAAPTQVGVQANSGLPVGGVVGSVDGGYIQGAPIGGGYIGGGYIDGGYQGMLPGGQMGEIGQPVDAGQVYDSGQFIDNGQWGGEVISSGGFAGESCNCYCTSPLMMGDSTIGVPDPVRGAQGQLVNYPMNFAKVADNNHVVPMDRISFGYRFYKAVPTTLTANGLNVQNERDLHELSVQAEKTFFCGNMSALVNAPFHHTIDLQQPGTTFSDRTNFEIGNLSFGLKALIWRTQQFAFSTGVLVEAPTADDRMAFAPPAQIVVENDSWFYTPYIGLEYTPNERWFAQGFASYRTRTSAMQVLTNGVQTASLQNPDRLMLDAKFGFWLYRGAPKTFSGFAPTIELHYMGNTEFVGNGFAPTPGDLIYGEVDRLNLTSGFTAEICNSGQLNFGIVTPLTQSRIPNGNINTNRMFDYNLTLQYNQRF